MIDSFNHLRWEYHIELIELERDTHPLFSNPQIQERLNKLGEEGWELIHVLERPAEYGTTRGRYTFKRPLAG